VELPPLADLLTLLRSQGVKRFSCGDLHVELEPPPVTAPPHLGMRRPEPPPEPNAVDLALEGMGKVFEADRKAGT
jgi:hypothetical protein